MLTRREFLQVTAATPFASLLPGAVSGTSRQPNVLLVMVDDLCPALGCYGSAVQSPNIDRLAGKGVRFERAYCQYPVCNPSRQSILSGLRPETTGIVTNWRDDSFRLKHPATVSLPQLFRQHGYFTASLGKVAHHGVDAAGKPADNQDPLAWDLCAMTTEAPGQASGEKGAYAELLTGPPWPAGVETWVAADGTDDDQEDGRLAAAAVKLIEEPRTKPFFLAVGFHKPHSPHIAPKKYFDLYPLESVVLEPEPADRAPRPPLGLPRADLFAKFDDQARRELKRAYLACVTFVDAQIGQVLAALDRGNRWENTIVVLMADHGYHLWQNDWFGKCTSYERSAHVPLVVWAPGQAGMGRQAPGLVESLDVYPTLAALCGLQAPPDLEGASFAAQLENPDGAGKAAAYTIVVGEDANYRYPKGKRQPGEGRTGQGVRSDRWRFIAWSDGRTELYDHTADPGEYHDLSADPGHREIVTQMQELLHRRNNAGYRAA